MAPPEYADRQVTEYLLDMDPNAFEAAVLERVAAMKEAEAAAILHAAIVDQEPEGPLKDQDVCEAPTMKEIEAIIKESAGA